MAISVGERFAGYEVAALIGVGGMGDVYRATDPARLAQSRQRPQIYGLERSADTTALVTELVDVPTLAERIAQGPLAVSDALNVAQQIASALEAAHERAIVHRERHARAFSTSVAISTNSTVGRTP